MFNEVYLLRRVKEGDIKAFEYIFKRYYSQLMIFAMGITGRQDIAEEIIQDLFYKLWKDRQDLNITRSLKSYLYGAVRNESLQYCEHRNVVENHRQKVLASGESVGDVNPEERMLYQELEDIIQRTLEQLPVRRREIFILHRFEGKKYKEIADSLSLSVKTVEAEMTKTYQALRKEIEKYICI